VRRLSSLEGEKLREAKEVLAYEATKLCHGEEEAEKARAASKALFEGKRREDDSAIPTFQIEADILEKGIEAFALLVESGLSKTRGQARRLIDQGGAYVNGVRIGSFNQLITKNDCDENGSILLRAGKKKYVRVKPKGL